MEIKALSYARFKEQYLKNPKFPLELTDEFFVCFHDSDKPTHFVETYENVLELNVDDINSEIPMDYLFGEKTGDFVEPILFSVEHSHKIINFFKLAKEKGIQKITAHCVAGKCRSGAVAEFACEFFGNFFVEDVRILRKKLLQSSPQIQANVHILNTLRRVYQEK